MEILGAPKRMVGVGGRGKKVAARTSPCNALQTAATPSAVSSLLEAGAGVRTLHRNRWLELENEGQRFHGKICVAGSVMFAHALAWETFDGLEALREEKDTPATPGC